MSRVTLQCPTPMSFTMSTFKTAFHCSDGSLEMLRLSTDPFIVTVLRASFCDAQPETNRTYKHFCFLLPPLLIPFICLTEEKVVLNVLAHI